MRASTSNLRTFTSWKKQQPIFDSYYILLVRFPNWHVFKEQVGWGTWLHFTWVCDQQCMNEIYQVFDERQGRAGVCYRQGGGRQNLAASKRREIEKVPDSRQFGFSAKRRRFRRSLSAGGWVVLPWEFYYNSTMVAKWVGLGSTMRGPTRSRSRSGSWFLAQGGFPHQGRAVRVWYSYYAWSENCQYEPQLEI